MGKEEIRDSGREGSRKLLWGGERCPGNEQQDAGAEGEVFDMRLEGAGVGPWRENYDQGSLEKLEGPRGYHQGWVGSGV